MIKQTWSILRSKKSFSEPLECMESSSNCFNLARIFTTDEMIFSTKWFSCIRREFRFLNLLSFPRNFFTSVVDVQRFCFKLTRFATFFNRFKIAFVATRRTWLYSREHFRYEICDCWKLEMIRKKWKVESVEMFLI